MDQLNQQQHSQVIEGYNQRTKAEVQVAPTYAIADALKPKKTQILRLANLLTPPRSQPNDKS
ncbi:MAG TPA: hypothetical protein VGH95_06560 [Candidatus Aquirickettsiella sp.]|jgi:hypothetical protein